MQFAKFDYLSVFISFVEHDSIRPKVCAILFDLDRMCRKSGPGILCLNWALDVLFLSRTTISRKVRKADADNIQLKTLRTFKTGNGRRKRALAQTKVISV